MWESQVIGWSGNVELASPAGTTSANVVARVEERRLLDHKLCHCLLLLLSTTRGRARRVKGTDAGVGPLAQTLTYPLWSRLGRLPSNCYVPTITVAGGSSELAEQENPYGQQLDVTA